MAASAAAAFLGVGLVAFWGCSLRGAPPGFLRLWFLGPPVLAVLVVALAGSRTGRDLAIRVGGRSYVLFLTALVLGLGGCGCCCCCDLGWVGAYW